MEQELKKLLKLLKMKKLQKFSNLWKNEESREMIEELKNKIVKIFGKDGDSFEYLEKHGFPATDAIVEIKGKYESKEYPDCIIQIIKEKEEYILYIKCNAAKEGCSINLLKAIEDISVFSSYDNIANKRVVITMKS